MDHISPDVLDEVVAFFASNPIGPRLSLSREAADPRSPIYEQLNAFLLALPAADVAATRADRLFQFFTDRTSNIDRAARVWLAERRLADEIPRRKLQLLRLEARAERPRPYDVAALANLTVDKDHLVSLSAFEFDGARLLRNGYAFLLLSTTGSPNSTFWLLRAIYSEGLVDKTRVRLDPFLYGPQEIFPAMFYSMWIYGRQLEWNRIATLQQPEHGRWLPGTLSYQSEFTDFVWDPRANEVHFVCEEVPGLAVAHRETSRYLHAVYLPASESISHLDGAIRIYTQDELRERHKVHVRTAAKCGIREKVFRTDGTVARDSFSIIAQAFFVWNEDVSRYLSRELVSGDSGSAAQLRAGVDGSGAERRGSALDPSAR